MQSDTEPGTGAQPGQPGPASAAAQRRRADAEAAGGRGYPPVEQDDPTGDAVALAATRALLKAESRSEAARVLHTAVNDMGGSVVPARIASDAALSVDVSLGVGEPQVVVVLDALDLSSMRLTHHLPTLVEDALAAAARCDHHQRQSLRAATDSLTGVASRGEIGLRLGQTAPGDVICMVDLDGLKEVNDTVGHDAGDQVLRTLGQLLHETFRDADFVGRYGGDEFVVILSDTPVSVALQRTRHLAASWILGISYRTSVSVGVAPVDETGPITACRAADRALYRAKRHGGDRIELADVDDYREEGPTTS